MLLLLLLPLLIGGPAAAEDGTELLLIKVTDPAGDPTPFPIRITGGPGVDQTVPVQDGQPVFVPLPSGTYAVEELVPAGWQLVSVVCVGDDTDSSYRIVLSEEEFATCTFTNRKAPSGPRQGC